MYEELTAFSHSFPKKRPGPGRSKLRASLRLIFHVSRKSWNNSLRISLLAELSVLSPNKWDKGNPGQQRAEEAQQLFISWEMFL